MAVAELPLETVGSRLRRAREAAGLAVPALAAKTRISVKQIEALEAGNYAALPGRTYAVGFSRTLARAVGLDEAEVAASTRAELNEIQGLNQERPAPTFEPGDPARVPSNRLTWLALGGVAVAIAAGLVFLPSLFSPGGTLPSILPADEPSAAAPMPAAAVPAPAAAGPVVFTALQPGVWVKFYDAAGTQLLQKELAQGETWTVPADKGEVLLWTARPDQLGITIGGQPVAKLSDVQKTMKDVPVTAQALMARGSAQAPVPVPVPIATSQAAPAARTAATARPQARVQRPAEQRNPVPRVETSPADSDLPAPRTSSSSATVPAPKPAAT